MAATSALTNFITFADAVEGTDGVIWKNALTEAVTTSNAPWSTIAVVGGGSGGADHTADGYLPDGANGEQAYQLTTLLDAVGGSAAPTSLDTAGQVSFDIETRVLAVPDGGTVDGTTNPNFVSTGYAGGGQAVFRESGATSDLRVLRRQPGESIVNSPAGFSTVENIYYQFKAGADAGDFYMTDAAWTVTSVRYALTWDSGTAYVFVDGCPIRKYTYTTAAKTNVWDTAYFGCDSTSVGAFIPGRIKNIVLSSTPVRLDPIAQETFYVVGDSILRDNTSWSAITGLNLGSATAGAFVNKTIFAAGKQPLNLTFVSDGGYSLVDYGSANSNFVDTDSPSTIEDCVTADPDYVLVCAGTNDQSVGDFTGTKHADGLVDVAERLLFGNAKNTRTNCKHVVFAYPPPHDDHTGSNDANMLSIRANLAALAAVWDGLYPQYAGMVSAGVDMQSLLGGRNAFDIAFPNALSADGTHLGPKSHRIVGEAIGEYFRDNIYSAAGGGGATREFFGDDFISD